MVLVTMLEHRISHVHAAGFADYGGCRSDACSIGEKNEGCVAGRTIERHRGRK